VSYAQLLGCGLTSHAIEHRAATGRLHRVHRGVYAVGHASLPPLGPEVAALLALGPAAVLSHRSAAVVWELLPPRTGPVEVTVVDARRASRRGIVVHSTAALPPRDRTRRKDLPLTSAVRTLIDIAHSPELEPALSHALLKRLVRPDELLERGGPAIRALLEGGPTPSRSELERRLLALVGAAGLPRPETNVWIGRWEVDALWRTQRLVAEVDGYAFHASRAQFERDRARDADLQAAGYRVIRLTWRQVTGERERIAARLAAALA
jgi:very-short-patch-repair endonuclease